MNSRLLPALALCAAGLLSAPVAHAEIYQLSFTATNYQPLFEGELAPESTITGWFRFSAASLDADIDAVTSVGLTINGNSYNAAGVGAEYSFGAYLFGETLSSDIHVVMAPSDDFLFQFGSGDAGTVSYYALATSETAWHTTDVTYAITPVPEPAPALMLLAGLALAGTLGWRGRGRPGRRAIW